MINKTSKFFINIYIAVVFIAIYSQSTFAQLAEEDSIASIKQGGVCFRYDDNSSYEIYRKIANIFSKYNAKFSLSLNFGDFWSDDYADSIRVLQQMGHEIMDHTPNHRTNYINTIFPVSDYVSAATGDTIPGIDHINGKKLCLEFKEIYLNDVEGTGNAVVTNNVVTGDFAQLGPDDIYLYFPKISQLVFISEKISSDTLVLKDVWGDDIDLGQYTNLAYYYFDRFNIHLTTEAIKLLANETLKLAEKYNLERPRTWIQPGGSFPQFTREELKEALGDEYEYYAGTGSLKGKQVFNEYDPNDDQRFEMQWGDFFEDYWTLDEVKSTIADRVAKHYMQIGHTHFFDLPGGEDAYLARVDSLLDWLTKNDIPIRTYSEWADILYDKKHDPYRNIFPSLNVDKDKVMFEYDVNGIPDGYVKRYWDGQGIWEVDTTSPGNQYCYVVRGAYRLCRVDFLAGLEKGKNDFKIKTKGEPGDSIEVIFTYGPNSQTPDEVFKFPSDTKDWKEYSLLESTNGNTELIVPEVESLVSIDIRCSDYVSGDVAIKDMFLAKSNVTSINESNDIIPESYSLLQNYPNPFNPSTIIKYSVPSLKTLQGESQLVQIKVYDILGREITTLVNRELKPGNYSINFNASSVGQQIASGIYFYSIKAGDYFQIKKMMLLK